MNKKEKFEFEIDQKEIKENLIKEINENIQQMSFKQYKNSQYNNAIFLSLKCKYKKMLYTLKLSFSNYAWDYHNEKFFKLKNEQVFWEFRKPKKDDIFNKYCEPIWKIGLDNNGYIEKKFLIKIIKLLFQEKKIEMKRVKILDKLRAS